MIQIGLESVLCVCAAVALVSFFLAWGRSAHSKYVSSMEMGRAASTHSMVIHTLCLTSVSAKRQNAVWPFATDIGVSFGTVGLV